MIIYINQAINVELSHSPARLQWFIPGTGTVFFAFSYLVPTISAMRKWLAMSAAMTVVTTGNRSYAECQRVCRVQKYRHSANCPFAECFWFAECISSPTRQIASLPSARIFALGKPSDTRRMTGFR